MQQLSRLANVSLLPHGNLTELQTRLANLKPCFALVTADLASEPVCPHCGFRPADEPPGPSSSVVIAQIDEEIDRMLQSWTKTLLDNLSDPTAQASTELLDPAQKKAVTSFIEAETLPEPVANDLIQGMQNALSGLERISVSHADLLNMLSECDTPCTVDDLRSQLEAFIQQLVKGKDVSKIRIVIERDDQEGTP